MVQQQVQNILRYLKEVHGIEKHLVTEALLPKGTPPFPGREYMSMKDIQKDMQKYLRENADPHGNLWGPRNTDSNKEDGREKVSQQVNNILCHLQRPMVCLFTVYTDSHSISTGTMTCMLV